MQSLKEVRLIHPIVVTADLTLVAGARRLEATKRLGATMIGKNLTPLERSQTTVRLAAAVGAQLRERAQTLDTPGLQPIVGGPEQTPTRTSPDVEAIQSKSDCMPTTGRTYEEKPDSQKKVAAEIGMSQSQVSDAQRHVAAVKRYPELGEPDVSQREALRLCRAWDDMSPPNRSRARKRWNAQRQVQRAQAEAQDGTPKISKPNTTRAPRAKAPQAPTVSAQVREPMTYGPLASASSVVSTTLPSVISVAYAAWRRPWMWSYDHHLGDLGPLLVASQLLGGEECPMTTETLVPSNDPEIEGLIPPVAPDERQLLEANLLADGCRVDARAEELPAGQAVQPGEDGPARRTCPSK
jgi:ParB-like chromosome segregation protein Spo0J